MTELIFIFTVSLIASFSQSAIGFGSAMICMALWPLILPYSTAIVLEVISALVLVTHLALILRKHINYKLLLPPVLVSIVFSFFGVHTLLSLSENTMRYIMGSVLILLAIYFYFIVDKIKLKPTTTTGLAAGVASGFMGGLFGISGPPMVAYYMSVTKDNTEYSATLQSYFIINNLSLFVIHMLAGNVSFDILPLSIASLLGVLLGVSIGIPILKKLSTKRLKLIVCIFMFCMGVYNIFIF